MRENHAQIDEEVQILRSNASVLGVALDEILQEPRNQAHRRELLQIAMEIMNSVARLVLLFEQQDRESS